MEINELKKRLELIKVHYGITSDELAIKSKLSEGTFYRMIKGQYSDKTLVAIAQHMGVSYKWLKEGIGEMFENDVKRPKITTQSTDSSVQALIEQINFLQSQLIVKDAQLTEKDVIIKSLVKPSPRTRHHSVMINRGVLVAARS